MDTPAPSGILLNDHRPAHRARHWASPLYAPQLYRQVLLRRVLAMGILSVHLSLCHDPVPNQAQVR